MILEIMVILENFGKFGTDEEFVGRGRGWGCVYAVYDDEGGGVF